MKAIQPTLIKWAGLSSVLLFIVIAFSNCNSAKQVPYFQDVTDSVNISKRIRNAEYNELTIHKGDVLHIEVSTLDAKIGGVANTEQVGNEFGKQQNSAGYMVDKNGDIEVPVIGRLHVEGLTTMQIKEKVREAALKFYIDPMVNIRIANFYITVLGEVRMPGRYLVNSEKINVVDAIGLAGDLTVGGKRANIIVIREENGESVFTRLSLNSTDLFQSKYFYLQSGDKIYVEPLRTVARSGTSDKNVDRYISLSLAIVSIMLATGTLIIRLQQ